MDNTEPFLVIVAITFAAFLFFLGVSLGNKQMETKAVAAGVAQYNSTNKNFEFITNNISR